MVIAKQSIGVIGGIDTHKDTHAVAAVTTTGELLGTAQFTSDPPGYRHLLAWLRAFGAVVRIGVEGTGSYGAGLTRYLRSEGISLVEVIRPKRQWRRRRGKSDPTDAEAAARAALSGEANGTPKDQDGLIEAYVCYVWRAVPRCLAGPRRSTNCDRSSRPHPPSCASDFDIIVSQIWS